MSIAPAVWVNVRNTLSTAEGIAWDGCHKIYVLMDATQMAAMEVHGYDPLLWIARLDLGADQAFEIVKEWWDDSCGLRFISAVRTVDGDPNEGFIDLIAQFA